MISQKLDHPPSQKLSLPASCQLQALWMDFDFPPLRLLFSSFCFWKKRVWISSFDSKKKEFCKRMGCCPCFGKRKKVTKLNSSNKHEDVLRIRQPDQSSSGQFLFFFFPFYNSIAFSTNLRFNFNILGFNLRMITWLFYY